jgi:hypothetical protein
MASPVPEKTGRNEPCPCGSGKKYKHCCALVAVASSDTPWTRQSEAFGRLTQEMLRFAGRHFGENIDAAWLDFNQDLSPLSLDEDKEEGQIFFPYDPAFDPELQRQAEAELQRYMQSWVSQKIPALGGRTPFEAVQDADGREVVEALLLEWERRTEGTVGPGAIRPDIDAIRRLLDLNPQSPEVSH